MTVINTSRGYIFIHIPKNAGRALKLRLSQEKDCLFDLCPPGIDDNFHAKAKHWLADPRVSTLPTVAIIRNPWDRALSIYLHMIDTCESNMNEPWAQSNHPLLIQQGFKAAWMPGGIIANKHGRKPSKGWQWIDQQVSWLHTNTKVFRIEDQLEDACKFLGIDVPSKFGATTHISYNQYYDDELKERIATLFADDIKLGGYTFE